MLLELAPRVGTPRGSLRGVPGERDALKLLCESLTERRKGFPPPGDARGEWGIAGGVTGILSGDWRDPLLTIIWGGRSGLSPWGVWGEKNAVRGKASDMPFHGAEEVDGVALACARHGEMQAP